VAFLLPAWSSACSSISPRWVELLRIWVLVHGQKLAQVLLAVILGVAF